MANPLVQESVWLQQPRFEEAEAHYQRVLAGTSTPQTSEGNSGAGSLATQISLAREQIQKVLNNSADNPGKGKDKGASGDREDNNLSKKVSALEKENKDLRKVTDDLRQMVLKLERRVADLEKPGSQPTPASAAAPAKSQNSTAAAAAEEDEDDDDDIDLFGSDNEEEAEEAAKLREQRLKEYESKKAAKKQVIAKSLVILDVKPWDDETDMKEMEKSVRSIEMDGLLWGQAKLVPLAYGIKKLQISMVIEDDKVSVEDMREQIETTFEEFVQSVDIAAFNKL